MTLHADLCTLLQLDAERATEDDVLDLVSGLLDEVEPLRQRVRGLRDALQSLVPNHPYDYSSQRARDALDADDALVQSGRHDGRTTEQEDPVTWRNPCPRPYDGATAVYSADRYWSLLVSADPALRIRSGAREACRRLRQERDSARRNLAALEWLTLRGYPVGQEPGGHRVSASPEPNGDPWFDSWEECARNAGMPG